MRRVLVTGANGFVGRQLCRHLAGAGFEVRAAVRRPDSAIEGAGEVVVVGEVGPDTEWDGALGGVDLVVHLAAHAHRVGVDGREHEETCRRVNVEGTRRLAEGVATRPAIERLLFVSSIGAVCSAATEPVDEATACRPDSAYGRSKLQAESLVREILDGAGRSWCILRPPLVYGPGNPGNMERLLRLVRTGLPLPFGGIHNRRSFIYVGNLVDVIERALRAPEAHRGTYTVSDAEDLSTPDLIRRLGAVTGTRVRMLPVPMSMLRMLARVGDAAARVVGRSVGLDTYSLDRLSGSLAVDSSRVRTELGWEPVFGVDHGLRATILQNRV